MELTTSPILKYTDAVDRLRNAMVLMANQTAEEDCGTELFENKSEQKDFLEQAAQGEVKSKYNQHVTVHLVRI